ncbi:MAG: YidC/Oxa1 family membrane protein insertase [Patescibacteria group bacterium]
MGNIFFTLLYQPLYNLLVILYNLLPWGGLGLAIILVTALIKCAVFPLTFKAMKVQKEMQEIQPKIAEIKAKFKDNQEQMAKELMAVYKVHKVNPFASCLPLILQLVIFITLYRVLSAGISTVDPETLYSFVHNPGVMAHMFLGMNLAKISIPLAILSAVAQYFQARQMVSRRPPAVVRQSAAALDEDMTASMNKMMLYVLPIMMLVLGLTTLPGGTTLYIFVSTVLTYILYAIFIKPPQITPPVSPDTKIIDVSAS